MTSQGIERITDALGYLVLNEEGAVISSGGDLENEEKSADIFLSMMKTACRIPLGSERSSNTLKRLSVVIGSYMYVLTASNQKVYVCKRHYNSQEPVTA